jgi:predicted nuclease with TOPRIM domain
MFKDSRNYVQEIQQKLRDVAGENERLRYENTKLQNKTNEVTDRKTELRNIEKERKDLESTINRILAEPFRTKSDGLSSEAHLNDQRTRKVEKQKKANESGAERKKNEDVLEKLKMEVE